MKELTKNKQAELSAHNYTMDSNTAWGLHKLAAIIGLLENATTDARTDEPMPEEVNPALSVAKDLLHSIMVRAGIVEAQS